ncbi:hypothetical protein QBC47DRAFT_2561 [Echria macrotheca]|uniref:Uncharacterized protein n=1 Tax=Echria macrotheca TaxID=438768 RepID=A0AAJ0BNS6_9PEZI|nr:hypothetical protein QBC47DRAFT_2561 [Echria macrotheca]
MAQVMKAVDYTQGFGSFLFEPLEDVDVGVRWTGSAPVTASDFPLMKLPLEIRRRIYGFVSEGLRHRHNDVHERSPGFPEPGIRFRVVDHTFDEVMTDEKDTLPGQVQGAPSERNVDHRTGPEDTTRVDLFEIYKSVRTGEFHEDNPNLPSNWRALRDDPMDYDSESEAVSSDADDDSDWDSDDVEMKDSTSITNTDGLTVKPRRCAIIVKRPVEKSCPQHGQPELQQKGGKRASKCLCEPIDTSIYDDIFNLGQTSRQVARELGQTLWTNATVEFDGSQEFFSFLTDRPNALAHVGGIILVVECNSAVADTEKKDLEAIFKVISEQLDLKYMGVELYTTVGRRLDRAAGNSYNAYDESSKTGKKLRDLAPLFRSLKTDAFTVKLNNVLSKTLSKRPQPAELDWLREVERMEGVVEQRVQSMWKPDCMRDEGEATERQYSLRPKRVR